MAELYDPVESTAIPDSRATLQRDTLSSVKSEVDKLLVRHERLVHSERKRVISHTQRETRNWIINTIMLQDYEVPFRFKRKKPYKDLKGSYVNLTYYPSIESVAGIDVEVMNVVRIRRN